MRKTGKIVSWKVDNGYGFIEPTDGGKQVFVHIKSMSSKLIPPTIGQFVYFELSTDQQGRICAENVQPIRIDKPESKANEMSSLTKYSVLVLIFTITIIILSFMQIIPFYVFFIYFVLSLITFVMYAFDKIAAKNGSRRTPEDKLHFIALIGGWPGALIAQQVLRHKTVKKEFVSVFWVTVIVNILFLLYVSTSYGEWVLRFTSKIGDIFLNLLHYLLKSL